MDIDNPLGEVAAHMKDTQVAVPVGVAAIALQMAMKYHDINMVKDGQLYQQYKLEGRNMQPSHLDTVFADALRIEAWLLGANGRFHDVVIDAVGTVIKAAIEGEFGDE